MTETLIQIRCPPPRAFTAAIVIDSGRVIQAAPIVEFMKTGKWSYARVLAHCTKKGWEVTTVRRGDG
jgi:hypothetical protein